MPKLKNRVPTYRLHRPSGHAIVTLNGVDHYLGPHGTNVSKAEYDRLVAEWLARGRQPAVATSTGPADVPLNQMILAFWNHAQQYYRKVDGTPTSEVESFRQALRHLRQLYGGTSALAFGPTALNRSSTVGFCNSGLGRGLRIQE